MHKIDIINHEMVTFTRRDYQALKILKYHIEKLLSLDNEKYILHCEQYSITVNYKIIYVAMFLSIMSV